MKAIETTTADRSERLSGGCVSYSGCGQFPGRRYLRGDASLTIGWAEFFGSPKDF